MATQTEERRKSVRFAPPEGAVVHQGAATANASSKSRSINSTTDCLNAGLRSLEEHLRAELRLMVEATAEARARDYASRLRFRLSKCPSTRHYQDGEESTTNTKTKKGIQGHANRGRCGVGAALA